MRDDSIDIDFSAFYKVYGSWENMSHAPGEFES